jgi:hypothetical protein
MKTIRVAMSDDLYTGFAAAVDAQIPEDELGEKTTSPENFLAEKIRGIICDLYVNNVRRIEQDKLIVLQQKAANDALTLINEMTITVE